MKKIIVFFACLGLAASLIASPVSREDAQKVAVKFYALQGKLIKGAPQVREIWTTFFESVPVFYTYRFIQGGFVIVAADDASIPILGYSFDNEASRQISNPALEDWLDSYGRQINELITNKANNRETRKQWKAILDGTYAPSRSDVGPLLTTKWDQGCYYNALCPVDSTATTTCSHVYTGCNATAMSQLMKYHNFPPQGVGTTSYIHPDYGIQSVDPGNTVYDWASMPDSLSTQNNAVATIMYHAGVALNLNYGAGGSGSMFGKDIDAFVNYFNYDPALVMVSKNLVGDAAWKSLLRTDLDNGLPVFYGCTQHAFICDGYTMSDDKFHFNWGWSGYYNGYFSIGFLNPGGSAFNGNNSAFLHLKPYNPDLIVRIKDPANYEIHEAGQSVVIKALLVRGSTAQIRLFIDNVEMASAIADSLVYTWNTSASDKGSHDVRAFAYSATDTVYHKMTLNIAQWRPQATGFTGPATDLWDVCVVDSNVVWGIGQYEISPFSPSAHFTRTVDGGNTWIPGCISDSAGLCVAGIFALDALKAWVLMFNASGTGIPGIFYTADGGVTWLRQNAFSTATWPNSIHFFNANEGWCYGDPVNGEFEIFTTVNGGSAWTQVDGANIPNPLAGGEYGTNAYSVVGDTIWFGTTRGRVFRSVDMGYTWTAYSVPAFTGRIVIPAFQSGSHGLAGELSWNNMLPRVLCETFDGGVTWSSVNFYGPVYTSSLAYVPGTANTWVSTGGDGNEEIGRLGYGCSYSLDGGHTWTDFPGTHGTNFFGMSWKNPHCAWAGGITKSATERGVYKFTGSIPASSSGLAPVIHPDHAIKVYPNPASGHITIESGRNMQEMMIFDRMGKLLIHKLVTGRSYNLDVSLLHPGIYELRIITAGGCSSTKIAVE